jgi:hypothetical protein
MDQLTMSLLDLLHQLEGRHVPITVGGGFGLYLKRQHLDATGQRTLFNQLPEPRATNDLDLFLRTEVLIDMSRTRQVADAVLRLGYTAVEEAKYLQWRRQFVVEGIPREVKIDILVGPVGEHRDKLHIKMPRVRPKGTIEFHAHAVEEAIHIEDEPIAVTITGKRSSGEPHAATVYIPQAFPYLMMKLHAFDDRKDDADKDLGRHHALDLYTIAGMMTEEEYGRARELGAAQAENQHVQRARAIVREQFGSRTTLGVLRLREHSLFRDEFRLDDFMNVLAELFPGG